MTTERHPRTISQEKQENEIVQKTEILTPRVAALEEQKKVELELGLRLQLSSNYGTSTTSGYGYSLNLMQHCQYNPNPA